MMYGMTQGQEQLYLEARKWLPNWSVSNLPNFFVSEIMTVPSNPFISVISGDLQLAAAIIAAYTVVSILIAIVRLVISDVTKKVD